jgi:hypothetical protein
MQFSVIAGNPKSCYFFDYASTLTMAIFHTDMLESRLPAAAVTVINHVVLPTFSPWNHSQSGDWIPKSPLFCWFAG